MSTLSVRVRERCGARDSFTAVPAPSLGSQTCVLTRIRHHFDMHTRGFNIRGDTRRYSKVPQIVRHPKLARHTSLTAHSDLVRPSKARVGWDSMYVEHTQLYNARLCQNGEHASRPQAPSECHRRARYRPGATRTRRPYGSYALNRAEPRTSQHGFSPLVTPPKYGRSPEPLRVMRAVGL